MPAALFTPTITRSLMLKTKGRKSTQTQGAHAQKLIQAQTKGADPGAARQQRLPTTPPCQIFTTLCSSLPIQNQVIRCSHDGMRFGMYG